MQIRVIALLCFLTSYIAHAQGFELGNPELHCTTIEERNLYNLITEYRTEQKLPVVEFSKSLSYVARIHAMDLSHNRPDFGGCNPHSWSDKGKWKPCCYNHDENRIACMTQKPKELTSYKYKAYEIVYYDEIEAKADDAFNLWKDIPIMNDYLLNSGKWEKQWLAVGVGIYDKYACVWFGEGKDLSGLITDCTSDSLIIDTTKHVDSSSVIENTSSSFYYIITSSTGTLEQANQVIAKLKAMGYKNALYLKKESFYRIAIDYFKDEQSAYRELTIIKKSFPQAWLLKPNR